MTTYITPYKLYVGNSGASTQFFEDVYRCPPDRSILVKNINITNISGISGFFSFKWEDSTVGVGTSAHMLAAWTPINAYESKPIFQYGFINMNKNDRLMVSGSIPGGLYILVSALEQSI